MMTGIRYIGLIGLIGLINISANAQQQPLQWHANLGRNMYVDAEGLPDHIGEDNLLWKFEMKKGSFFNIPTVYNGRVYLGLKGNCFEGMSKRNGVLLCLDLHTGKKIWLKDLENGGGYGLADVPVIDGERIYVRTPGENQLICLNMDGEFVWKTSLSRDYSLTRMHGPAGTGLLIGEQLWWPTGHAPGSDCVNWETNSLEAPFHPNIMVFDRKTGKLVAEDDLEIGPVQHGQWSSLSSGVVNGKRLVFFGDAFGYVHAFDVPETGPAAAENPATLKEVWRCDANPRTYRYYEDGSMQPYAGWMGNCGPKESGPCEVIAPPVFHDGKLYVTISRDAHYSVVKRDKNDPHSKHRRWGAGAITCINPNGEGDITGTNKIWENTQVNRTFCPPSIAYGLIFFADHSGYVNCLDQNTGELIWKFDNQCEIWNYFQVVADRKIYVTSEQDGFFIINATREGGKVFHTTLDAKNNPTVGITDGMIIVGTGKSISAYKGPGYKAP